MSKPGQMIAGGSCFAAALIGSSWLLRGSALGDWVDAALYIAMGSFFAYHILRLPALRSRIEQPPDRG